MTPAPRHGAAILLTAASCLACQEPTAQVVLASTTSTEDSGLFDRLIPAFEAGNPYEVKTVAVGTGQALALGRAGDADVLLVHAPRAESTFVAAGHGDFRRPVMYNDFVVVGPPADPAGIRGAVDAAGALARILDRGELFVSRGDDSGTHRKELGLWAAAGREPDAPGASYMEAGQGMGNVLRITSEKGGYTLSDRGTFLFLRDALELEVLVEGDEALFNPYGVILAAGAQNRAGALAFIEWLTGPGGQAVIRSYGEERFRRPLFVPMAGDSGR